MGIKYYAIRAEPFGFAQDKLHERKPSTVKALLGQVVIQGTKYLLALDLCLINEGLLRRFDCKALSAKGSQRHAFSMLDSCIDAER